MAQSDAQIIARAATDPSAFGVIFDRHYDVVYRFLAAWTGVDAAEDLASQVFLVAFERLDGYDPARSDARPWLLGIAVNLVRHHWRARGRASAAMSRLRRLAPGRNDDGSLEDTAQRVDSQRRGGQVLDAVKRLRPVQRDALLLLAFAELSYSEIAAVLQVPVGTVRSSIHRARHAVQEQVGASVEDVR